MPFVSCPTDGLLTVHFSAKDLDVSFPSALNGLDAPTAKSIYNAWMETSIIDNYGTVWVLPNRLSEILRTSKANANYIVSGIERQYKSEGADGAYLYYPEVNKQLCKIIMQAGSIKREKYAGFSESIGITIRDSAKARLKRAETYAAIKSARRKLKGKRIGWLSIKRDELTNIPLLITSEFSHIRSCALYPQYSTCLWNGLIVNKPIHQIITDAYVNDEGELFDLCIRRGWSTGWYEGFLESIA
jgi:hypothetical protein